MLKILVYPYDSNPYQRLLYGAMCESDSSVKIRYLGRGLRFAPGVITVILLPILLVCYRVRGFRLLHLHWPRFYFSSRGIRLRLASYLHSLLIINVIKAIGLKCVYTIHNIIPHEEATSCDREIAARLCRLADVKIVHSECVVDEMSNVGMDIDRTVVIPHGNYIGYYRNDISRSEARRLLCMPQDAFVFLYFGIIRPYKGIENLLEAFVRVKTDGSWLILTGLCVDSKIRERIEAYKAHNVIGRTGYVRDDDVQIYMNGADVVVLPFERITTSGSVHLALSFGKPIVYPARGALRDLPEGVGWSYVPESEDALDKRLVG